MDRERLAAQRRDDEVRHDAAVRRLHARAVRVEDSGNARVDPVLAPVVRERRLGAALPFVIARARPDRIDVSPVVFGLRMLDGVPVNLAGRSLQDRRAQPLRESEQVDSTAHAGLRPLHRIALVTTR